MEQSYRPARLLLQWHLTERCNLRCTHCYQDTYRDNGAGMSAWLPVLEQYRSFLAGAANPISGHITLTGGEPFAHPEFPALLEKLAGLRKEFTFAILCNGTLVDAAMAQRLAHWGPRFVQVSIDGRPATHDALRGAGNHARVVGGIRHMVSAGVRTMISFTAHRDNFREFPEVAKLARDLQVARVWADRLIPQGAGAQLHGMSVAETQEFIDGMRQAQRDARPGLSGRQTKTEVALHRALQFLAGGTAYRCTAGDSLITVMPDGTLYPCRRMPITIGNLNQTSLASLYDSRILRELRDPAPVARSCEPCAYERLCRGGLRCLSYAVHKSPHVADPGCWLAAAPAAAAASAAATPAVAAAI